MFSWLFGQFILSCVIYETIENGLKETLFLSLPKKQILLYKVKNHVNKFYLHGAGFRRHESRRLILDEDEGIRLT